MTYIIIKTTFATKKEAEDAARRIIEKKLAACIQLSEVESYYRWNNKTEKSHEYKLEIKTLDKNYKKIEDLITKHHKYKIPEIVSLKLHKGSKEYLDWMKCEVK